MYLSSLEHHIIKMIVFISEITMLQRTNSVKKKRPMICEEKIDDLIIGLFLKKEE